MVQISWLNKNSLGVEIWHPSSWTRCWVEFTVSRKFPSSWSIFSTTAYGGPHCANISSLPAAHIPLTWSPLLLTRSLPPLSHFLSPSGSRRGECWAGGRCSARLQHRPCQIQFFFQKIFNKFFWIPLIFGCIFFNDAKKNFEIFLLANFFLEIFFCYLFCLKCFFGLQNFSCIFFKFFNQKTIKKFL